MPKRTTLFQEVVEIIHSHMAGDAEVEASAMLESHATGTPREVDVVIRTRTSGYEVLVSVEAQERSRKADRTWVDAMLGKHNDLTTNKLVLVSEKGFTKDARKHATAAGAVPLSPEDLEGEDPAAQVLGAARSLWPKQVAFTPTRADLMVEQPGGIVRFQAMPDTQLFFDDGTEVGQLIFAIWAAYRANWPRVMDQIGLADIEADRDATLVMQVGPPWTVKHAGKTRRLCLKGEDPPYEGELHPIERLVVTGKAKITVTEVPLAHRRLGEVAYAYGEGKVGKRDALIVATQDAAEEGKITVRLREEADDPGIEDQSPFA